jgi:hypothetical protein
MCECDVNWHICGVRAVVYSDEQLDQAGSAYYASRMLRAWAVTKRDTNHLEALQAFVTTLGLLTLGGRSGGRTMQGPRH